MRKLITLAALMSLYSCAKKSTPTPAPTPTPTTPASTSAHFISNWHGNDTLVATTLDANNQANGFDTIFTKAVIDTSYIIYKGKQFYIWKEPVAATDSFKVDEMLYVNVVISPTRNIADAISKSLMNAAYPHKYKDQQGNWSYQRQNLVINDYTNFKKTNGGVYMALNKKP